MHSDWTSTFYVTVQDVDLYTASGIFYAVAPRVRFEFEAIASHNTWHCSAAMVLGTDDRNRDHIALDLDDAALEHTVNGLHHLSIGSIDERCRQCLAEAPAQYQAA